MSIRWILRNRKGLTLIEVLLSITILGIIATSFLSFFNQAYSYTKKNEDKTVGINVARNVLNYFEQQDFGKIKDTYFPDSFPDDQVEITKSSCAKEIPGKLEVFFSAQVDCEDFFSPEINNVEFTPTIILTRNLSTTETKPNLEDQLIGIEVKVDWNKQSTLVKGLIKK